MKKLLCILLVLFTLVACISCSKEEVKNTLALGGIDISEYTVVVGEDSDDINFTALKDRLVNFVLENYEVELKVYPKDADLYVEHAIYIGDEDIVPNATLESAKANEQFVIEDKKGTIIYANGSLWIAGNNKHSLATSLNKFISDITPNETKKTEVSYNEPVNVTAEFSNNNEMISVMSYNVKTGKANKNSSKIFDIIKSHEPDIVGLQEFGYDWITAFKKSDLANNYTYVGTQRDGDGTDIYNEASPILYKTDKFECIKWETLWLTATPRKVSTLSTSKYNRIMTYAVLERKSDGKRFLAVNVHPDYDSNNDAQTKILLNLVESINNEYGNLPTIFTGDYNCTEAGAGYNNMVSSGLDDARYIAFNTTDKYTFPDVDSKTPNPRIIDFIFLSGGKFDVKSFSVNVSNASDHYSIYAQIYLK